MAVRFQCPIYAIPKVLDEAGIVFDSMSEPQPPRPPASQKLANLSKDKLMAMLEKALENEEYEKAAKIRDELKNRKSSDPKAED